MSNRPGRDPSRPQGDQPTGLRGERPTLTRKDREALEFGIRQKVDYIALSFVRGVADLEAARRILARRKSKIPLIAKLEKPQAISHLEAILEAADGVMVARGDLGVEMPPEKVPIVQKQIIRAANARALPVITATQMLFSMISNPRPTRAEASDVANAILDGTDAVMLSGETAIGRYPVRTVEMISRIIMEAETAARKRDVAPEGAVTPASVVTRAACDAVQALKARAIVAFTQSGLTARFVARNRPAVPILAYTHDERILKRMALYWGGDSPVLAPGRSHRKGLRAGGGTTPATQAGQRGRRHRHPERVSPLRTGSYQSLKASDPPSPTPIPPLAFRQADLIGAPGLSVPPRPGRTGLPPQPPSTTR